MENSLEDGEAPQFLVGWLMTRDVMELLLQVLENCKWDSVAVTRKSWCQEEKAVLKVTLTGKARGQETQGWRHMELTEAGLPTGQSCVDKIAEFSPARKRNGKSIPTYGRFMLIHGRNQHNIIKQLSSN